MLRSSFVLLSGVGQTTEAELWQRGVRSWTDFHEADPDPLPGRVARRYEAHAKQLTMAEAHLERGHTSPFARWLPSGETWRLLDEIGEDVMYLDIETTGLSYPQGRTTVVGYHLPAEGTELLVRGQDLNQAAIQDALDRAGALVTFNGKRFDVPFLKREFGVQVEVPHIDLMYAFRKLGITGGLKSIETQLGLAREDEIDGMGGYEAVRLWRAWERGDRSALETLLAYNEADVVNMVPLAETAYERLRERTFGEHETDARSGQAHQSTLAVDEAGG